MAETLTRSESQSVITDLKNQVIRLKEAIKQKDLVGESVEILNEKKDALQDELNKLLKKGGLITEEDYNNAYEKIRQSSQERLITQSKKTKRSLYFVVGGVLILAAGIYLYKRLKK